MRWAMAVIVSSIVVYMWGFFFFAASGYPEQATLKVDDNAAVGEALKEHFPENGLYFLPSQSEEEGADEYAVAHKTGPVAMVYMLKADGRDLMDIGILISGFCHIMLTSIFLCFLLRMADASLAGWFARVRFFVFVGFLIVFYCDIGNAVWWQYSWHWQLTIGLHHWVAISIAGIVIATIVPGPERKLA